MTAAQAWYLRRALSGRLEGRRTMLAVTQIAIASALMGAVAWGVWRGLDQLLGASLAAQLLSMALAALVGLAVYVAIVLALRLPEAFQMQRLIAARLRRGA